MTTTLLPADTRNAYAALVTRLNDAGLSPAGRRGYVDIVNYYSDAPELALRTTLDEAFDLIRIAADGATSVDILEAAEIATGEVIALVELLDRQGVRVR